MLYVSSTSVGTCIYSNSKVFDDFFVTSFVTLIAYTSIVNLNSGRVLFVGIVFGCSPKVKIQWVEVWAIGGPLQIQFQTNQSSVENPLQVGKGCIGSMGRGSILHQINLPKSCG